MLDDTPSLVSVSRAEPPSSAVRFNRTTLDKRSLICSNARWWASSVYLKLTNFLNETIWIWGLLRHNPGRTHSRNRQNRKRMQTDSFSGVTRSGSSLTANGIFIRNHALLPTTTLPAQREYDGAIMPNTNR